MSSLRCCMIDKNKNDEGLLLNLDLLEETREMAAIAEEKHKRNMKRKKEDTGKFGPKWEGPYEIIKVLGDRAYKLRDQEGKELPRTWNIADLKRCYT
ncbi:hypothetical protein Tco_0680834 [Tanacetum coccineum]|uniref:Reverse transcriptase n=1 Tax=Tanacetum coccineum TaxID=301880 RepID=A0ABQ4XLW8_9ASTR